MRNLLFFGYLLAISFLGAIDRKLSDQFELLVQQARGVLTDFPEEVRELRRGSVVQKVFFSNQDELTISLTFLCSQDDGTITEAKFSRTIHLADLALNKEAVILNEHLNTITFKQPSGVYSLSFENLQQARCAKKLLDDLSAKAVRIPRKEASLASHLAREEKYTYLLVAPRNEELSEAVRGLFANGAAPRNVAWLTKKCLQDIDGMVQEAFNCLPIFVYDLSMLDAAPFCTVGIQGSTSSMYVSTKDALQPAVSSDEKALSHFLKAASFIGIRFFRNPGFGVPVCVICKEAGASVLRKAASDRYVQIPENLFKYYSGIFSSIDVPLGSTQFWLTGINNNSYEALGYCFQNEQITHNAFSGLLYREFPHLRTLLKGGSRYLKGLTREQAICCSLRRLSGFKHILRKDLYEVLQVALFSCELGVPFGSDAEIGYNSLPFALAISEKIGLNNTQEGLVDFLVREDSALIANQQEEDQPEVAVWHCLAGKAGSLGLPAEDVLTLKKIFTSIVSGNDAVRSPTLQLLDTVQKSFKHILCFGVPFGCKSCQGLYPVRSLYSSYIWEVRDPKHRDGLALNRRRSKFEAMMLQSAKRGGKNSFWDWLERGVALPSTVYVTEENREDYRAVFENGRLIRPAVFSDCVRCELLFVVDEWGRVYVALKEDAKDARKHNFNHASIFRGNPVASAGKMIIENGKPVEILDHSGHYRPSKQQMVVAVRALLDQGVDIEHLIVNLKIERKKWKSGVDFLRSER